MTPVRDGRGRFVAVAADRAVAVSTEARAQALRELVAFYAYDRDTARLARAAHVPVGDVCAGCGPIHRGRWPRWPCVMAVAAAEALSSPVPHQRQGST